jgi:hypothetical protein
MPEDIYARAVDRQKELGYPTFSDYIQALIRADAVSRAAHVREPEVQYRVSSPSEADRKDTARRVVDTVKKHYPRKAAPGPSAPRKQP